MRITARNANHSSQRETLFAALNAVRSATRSKVTAREKNYHSLCECCANYPQKSRRPSSAPNKKPSAISACSQQAMSLFIVCVAWCVHGVCCVHGVWRFMACSLSVAKLARKNGAGPQRARSEKSENMGLITNVRVKRRAAAH